MLALSNRLASTPLTGRGPGGSAEVASFDSEAAEGEWIIAQADALSRLGSVAILTRSNAHAAQIAAFLPYAEVQRAKPAARLHACKRLIASGEKSSRVIARACPFPDYRPSLLALLEETKVEDWLIAFDEWVELRDPSPRRIYVGTVHSVKGQEFDSVVIPGVDTYGDEPEEARVLYVAMTRAREHLRVSASSVRGGARRSAPHLSRIR